jgi:hypothetical protein
MSVQIIGDDIALSQKGDIATSDGTAAIRLPAGSNNQILFAQSSTPSGLLWQDGQSQAETYMESIAYSQITSNVAAGSSINFTNIPQTYTDLLVIHMSKSTDASIGGLGMLRILFNNQTVTTDSGWLPHRAQGTTTPVLQVSDYPTTPVTDSNVRLGYTMGNHSNGTFVFVAGVLRIYNYSSTSTYKPFFSSMGNGFVAASTTDSHLGYVHGNYLKTTAITQLNFKGDYGTLAGSWFALYGIK